MDFPPLPTSGATIRTFSTQWDFRRCIGWITRKLENKTGRRKKTKAEPPTVLARGGRFALSVRAGGAARQRSWRLLEQLELRQDALHHREVRIARPYLTIVFNTDRGDDGIR